MFNIISHEQWYLGRVCLYSSKARYTKSLVFYFPIVIKWPPKPTLKYGYLIPLIPVNILSTWWRHSKLRTKSGETSIVNIQMRLLWYKRDDLSGKAITRTYKNFHHKDMTVLRPSILCDGNPNIWKDEDGPHAPPSSLPEVWNVESSNPHDLCVSLLLIILTNSTTKHTSALVSGSAHVFTIFYLKCRRLSTAGDGWVARY